MKITYFRDVRLLQLINCCGGGGGGSVTFQAGISARRSQQNAQLLYVGRYHILHHATDLHGDKEL